MREAIERDGVRRSTSNTLSAQCQHASVVMLERYAHLSQADLKAAVDRKKVSSDVTRSR